jgi:hypothetical protein
MSRCTICDASYLKALDDDIENGLQGIDIARKYNVNPMMVSRHKQHKARNSLEDVRTILNTAVDHEKIQITNAGDYLKLLEWEDKNKFQFDLGRFEKLLGMQLDWKRVKKWLDEENYEWPELEKAIENIQMENYEAFLKDRKTNFLLNDEQLARAQEKYGV